MAPIPYRALHLSLRQLYVDALPSLSMTQNSARVFFLSFLIPFLIQPLLQHAGPNTNAEEVAVPHVDTVQSTRQRS
jgi:hypothetical protein